MARARRSRFVPSISAWPSRKHWARKPCAMSLEAEIKRGELSRGRLLYFPVAPGRVEFSAALRQLLLERRPKIVALELPEFLRAAYRQALDRLPEMSVILYMEEQDDDDRAIYVP